MEARTEKELRSDALLELKKLNDCLGRLNEEYRTYDKHPRTHIARFGKEHCKEMQHETYGAIKWIMKFHGITEEEIDKFK